MDLTSPHAFWLIRNGVGEVSSPLPNNRSCDIVVIGAGIIGALIADALTAAGLSVIVIDRRYPGHGSTSASTALLQYEVDTHLTDLIDKLGRERAVDAYQACLEGVRAIGRLVGELEDVGFRRRPSLYYASRLRDVKVLRKEGAARRQAKLPCEVLEEKEVSKLVDFGAPLALWSEIGGEVDPWRMTYALLARCATRDFALYGRTDAMDIVTTKKGMEVPTDRGRIHAKHVIVAAGYESERFLPKRVAKLYSSYALITEPVKAFEGWSQRCLVWESARPYLYARTTSDNRILVGGEDIPFRNSSHRDARVPAKASTLIDKVRRLFPRIAMEPAYAWAGTFGETKDGLAYIGAHPGGDARVHYALGYGGNGITFGAIAAEVLTAAVLKKPHRYRDTFAFDR
ncbi:MAG: FAD-binding oxidoreductase [Pyrinomonadaceae bacterium]|nr:FAD-binding oxidoreductase [Pyrinomonadaceae bacterium]